MIPDMEAWVVDESDHTQNLIEKLQQNGVSERPLEKLTELTEIQVNEGTGKLHLGFRGENLVISGSFCLLSTEENRRMTRSLAKALNMGQEVQADDRGRVTIGSQYANKKVRVLVTGVEDE